MTRWPPGILVEQWWLMSLGERAALEGLLGQLRPALAVEIGTGGGASMRRIAAHAGEVHSIDIVAIDAELPSNVRFHLGDSRRVLPELLDGFARERRNVDFALVDGDHSAGGVRSDLEDLLESRAVGRTVIVVHDTLNPDVRRGIEAVGFDRYPHVRFVGLDFVPGFMVRSGPFGRRLWGGLGLVVVDAEGTLEVPEHYLCDTPTMIRLGARRLRWEPIAGPLRRARARLAAARSERSSG